MPWEMTRLRQSEWAAIDGYMGQKYGDDWTRREGQPATDRRRVGVCKTDGCPRLAHPDGGGLCQGCYRRTKHQR